MREGPILVCSDRIDEKVTRWQVLLWLDGYLLSRRAEFIAALSGPYAGKPDLSGSHDYFHTVAKRILLMKIQAAGITASLPIATPLSNVQSTSARQMRVRTT
jgi:hypothetical protein